MRTLPVLCSVLLFTALSFGQNGRAFPGYCPYGCGPYIPMLTTPSLTFTTISPNPTGATNATGGLVAGATNSTLSEVSGNSDAVFTMPVWYSGGQTPLISPVSAGSPPSAGAPMPPALPRMMNAPERRREMRRMEGPEEMQGEEMHGQPATQQAWVYFTGAGPAGEAASGNARPATRTYSNQDVARQEERNGLVKYDSKTEKIQ
ncbi:MAG: hypothetical protein WB523_01940 [Candidatus Sulfotelmatobacter sp.]